MPLIKLARTNKSSDNLLNSDHIVFIETESKTTAVHLTGKLLFSVEELPAAIAARIEELETARLKNAIIGSGLATKSA